MPNTPDTAAQWTEFVAAHPAFPAGAKLRAAFQAGKITRLCDCGCNAYEFEMPEDSSAALLVKPGGSGAVFELSFQVSTPNSNERRSLEFIVFADRRGHFAGIEVD